MRLLAGKQAGHLIPYSQRLNRPCMASSTGEPCAAWALSRGAKSNVLSALAFAQAVHSDDHGVRRVTPHQREHGQARLQPGREVVPACAAYEPL